MNQWTERLLAESTRRMEVNHADKAWIGSTLFVSGLPKGKWRYVLPTPLVNWWYPPRLVHTARPNPAADFARRLFLWMPSLMRTTCHDFGSDEGLRSKGALFVGFT